MIILLLADSVLNLFNSVISAAVSEVEKEASSLVAIPSDFIPAAGSFAVAFVLSNKGGT